MRPFRVIYTTDPERIAEQNLRNEVAATEYRDPAAFDGAEPGVEAVILYADTPNRDAIATAWRAAGSQISIEP